MRIRTITTKYYKGDLLHHPEVAGALPDPQPGCPGQVQGGDQRDPWGQNVLYRGHTEAAVHSGQTRKK